MERVEQVNTGIGAVQLGVVNGDVIIVQCPHSAAPCAAGPIHTAMLMRALLVFAAITAAASPAWAINKCTGPDGKVVYQDAPCEGGANVNLSGAGAGNPGAAGPSYYQREGARLATEEKAEEARRVRNDRIQNAIFKREVVIGMTADEVRRSWGEPNKINASMGSYGRTEQWVYDRGDFKAQYVYLDNGVVRSMQSPR